MIPTFASPAVLYLLPLLLAVLIFIRFFQTRRREVLAGSLMLWRRLAAQQPKVPPKRFIIDRSLILQCLILVFLVLALASPTLALGSSGRHAFVLMIDNGALSRARIDGAPGIVRVREAARRILQSADRDSNVLLCRSAPLTVAVSNEPLSISEALTAVEKIEPCVALPEPEAIWLVATDTARVRGGESALPLQVVSLQNGPKGVGTRWICVSPEKAVLQNAGIVAFGSTNAGTPAEAVNLLVRVKNFGTQEARGAVVLPGGVPKRELTIAPGSDEVALFENVPAPVGMKVEWKSAAGPDSFSDDDAIFAARQAATSMTVRFHSPLPALEALYRSIPAKILNRDSSGPADLEVYVQHLPEHVPDGAKAIMLIAPPSGYRSIFDVGPNATNHPQAQRDEDDSLTQFIGDKPESSFGAGKSIEVLRTGDFKSLIKDQKTGRTLAARFEDDGRTGYLLAFVPGAGLAEGRKLEPPLAALLIRMAREAGRLGDPLTAMPLRDWETQNSRGAPADWISIPEIVAGGRGVLDERISGLKLGTPAMGEQAGASFLGADERRIAFAPWLALLAVALIVIELWLQGTGSMRTFSPSQAVKK